MSALMKGTAPFGRTTGGSHQPPDVAYVLCLLNIAFGIRASSAVEAPGGAAVAALISLHLELPRAEWTDVVTNRRLAASKDLERRGRGLNDWTPPSRHIALDATLADGRTYTIPSPGLRVEVGATVPIEG